MNGRDPTGTEAAASASGNVIITNPKTGKVVHRLAGSWVRQNPLAVQDLLQAEGGLSRQQTKDFMESMGLSYTHPYNRPVIQKNLPEGDNWTKNIITATSGLPPQNRQQELAQGGLQIAETAVMVVGGTFGNAGTVSAEVMMNYEGAGPVTVSQADAEGWLLPHRNRLDADGPHDVYAVVDVNTRQVYHFGETGRGWETRGREWQRKLAKEYGLETEVVPLRTGLPGKAAAKELETRYIETYEKAFGQKPFYVDENGQVVPIQKTRH